MSSKASSDETTGLDLNVDSEALVEPISVQEDEAEDRVKALFGDDEPHADVENENEFKEEGASCLENLTSCASVDVHLDAVAHEQVVEDGGRGDMNPRAGAEAAGAVLETAEAAEGFAKVEIGEIGKGRKLGKEVVSFVERNPNAASDAASRDLMDGRVEAMEGIPMELKEDGLGGDQKLGFDMKMAVSVVETGEAQTEVFLEASNMISSEDVLNLGGTQLDIGKSCIQTDPDDAKCCDLVVVNVQAKESSLSLGDTGPNRAEAAVEIAARREDMGSSLPVEIKEDFASKLMVRNSEVMDAVMPEADQEGHHEALVLHRSLVSVNSDAEEVGCSVPIRKMEVGLVPLDEPVIDEADLVVKDSHLVEPAVEETHNQDSMTDNDIQIVQEEVVTTESTSVTNQPFAEAENGHAHVVIDNQRGRRDFATIEVASGKTAVDNKPQKLDACPIDENVMAGFKSVSCDAVLETERRETQLVDENPTESRDVMIPDARFLVQTQGADACPHGESLMLKEGAHVEDDNTVEFNVLKPSESSVGSQGKRSVDSLPSENEKPEIESTASLDDEGLGASTHEAGTSVFLPEVMAGQSCSQNLDAESNALKADIPPSEVLSSQEVEIFQKLDGNGGTVMLADVDVGIDIDVGTDDCQKVQDGEKELLQRINKQVARCDGTSTMEGDQCARYHMSPEESESFSSSDLVWGKVKSHPWWPGQIYDSSHASEMALRHQRKDCFLVAYFGDKTFAWCEEAQLKPFQKYFSQMEKQSSLDAFVNSVGEVLEEVSRRIELGMVCPCLSEEGYANIKQEKVENAGIQEGTCNSFIDRSRIVSGFQPASLLEFIQALAQFPNGRPDKLDLVIAEAQLKAFYRSKGYPELPVFLVCGGLVENDVENSPCSGKESDKGANEHSIQTLSGLISENRKKRGRKRKYNEEIHITENGRKQKSLSELMEEESTFNLMNGSRRGSKAEIAGQSILHVSGEKYVVVDSDSADAEQRKTKRFDSLRDSETKSPPSTPICSFKVGEWIRRAASQLTASTPILKSCSENFQRRVPKADHIIDDDFGADASVSTSSKTLKRRRRHSEDPYSSNELLSQLCLAAGNPMKIYNFVFTVVGFFTEFRNSCSLSCKDKNHAEKTGGKRGRKRRADSNIVSPPASSDTCTPDHMQDSYWSDMIFHNSTEKKPFSNGLKREGESHMRRQKRRRKHETEAADTLALGPVLETARPFQLGALSRNMNPEWLAERPMIILEEKIVDECTPTELVLNFNKPDSIPSETDLIRIFSRYGPLKEAETEVLRKTNRAKVVFKKRADAEIAFSSAGKFSIFGPTLLSYKLRYLPSTPKASLTTTPQGKRDVAPTDSENMDISAQAEPSASAVGDLAQVDTRAVAMAEPAQSETGTMVVADPVQAETGALAVADPDHFASVTLAVTDPVEAEIRAMLVADPETGELASAGPAPLEVGTRREIDLVQMETGTLKEADPAQAETWALTEAEPETGEVAVADPETRAAADPVQVESKVVAMADSTEVEAMS